MGDLSRLPADGPVRSLDRDDVLFLRVDHQDQRPVASEFFLDVLVVQDERGVVPVDVRVRGDGVLIGIVDMVGLALCGPHLVTAAFVGEQMGVADGVEIVISLLAPGQEIVVGHPRGAVRVRVGQVGPVLPVDAVIAVSEFQFPRLRHLEQHPGLRLDAQVPVITPGDPQFPKARPYQSPILREDAVEGLQRPAVVVQIQFLQSGQAQDRVHALDLIPEQDQLPQIFHARQGGQVLDLVLHQRQRLHPGHAADMVHDLRRPVLVEVQGPQGGQAVQCFQMSDGALVRLVVLPQTQILQYVQSREAGQVPDRVVVQVQHPQTVQISQSGGIADHIVGQIQFFQSGQGAEYGSDTGLRTAVLQIVLGQAQRPQSRQSRQRRHVRHQTAVGGQRLETGQAGQLRQILHAVVADVQADQSCKSAQSGQVLDLPVVQDQSRDLLPFSLRERQCQTVRVSGEGDGQLFHHRRVKSRVPETHLVLSRCIRPQGQGRGQQSQRQDDCQDPSPHDDLSFLSGPLCV